MNQKSKAGNSNMMSQLLGNETQETETAISQYIVSHMFTWELLDVPRYDKGNIHLFVLNE